MRAVGYKFRSTIVSPPSGSVVGPLKEQGPRRIQHLTYSCVFVGAIWRNDTFSKAAADLRHALEQAVSSEKLNSVFSQYFENQPVTIRQLPSVQLDAGGWMSSFSAKNAEALLAELRDEGKLPVGPAQTAPYKEQTGPYKEEHATFFILPPGTVLVGPDGQENNLDNGLHAFHYRYNLQPEDRTLYYAVAAWGDGAFGIGKPGWTAWENTCAMLYHELSEILTNPDINAVKRSEKGWYILDGGSDQQEIGDLPILYFEKNPLDAFRKVADGQGNVVPIQLMWSNLYNAPWDPEMASGPHPLGIDEGHRKPQRATAARTGPR